MQLSILIFNKMKGNVMKNVIMNYLAQSSTYKGLFTILAALGVTISGGMSDAIAGVCLAVVGLINVINNEKSRK